MRQCSVTDPYEYCRKITRRASKTFYWGSSFLPQPKRKAIWAVYAFCRMVDDIVDEAVEAEGTREPRTGHLYGVKDPRCELDYWHQSLQHVYNGEGSGDSPIMQAWEDMLQTYAVPIKPALELLDGVAMDLSNRRYQSFAELELYCYRVAGTVGLLTSPIFGYNDERALTYAVELGIALQLTNILRDVGEDLRRNRIYLPLEEMERFRYSEEDLQQGVINDAFRELIHFQMARAEEYYIRGQQGIGLLHPDCQLSVKLSGVLYQRILERIRSNDYNVFTKRASIPLQTKLVAASVCWVMQHVGSRHMVMYCK
jgi:phytoene synthase